MKALIAAAAAALFLAGPALAQTETVTEAPITVSPSRCAAPSEPPAPLDGATVTAAQMEAGITALNAWVATVDQHLDCLRDEHRELVAHAHAREAEHNEKRAAAIAVQTAWQAQADVFNARPARRRR